MNAKVVRPEKITSAPVASLVRIIADDFGADMLSRVRVMHTLTAGEIWDQAVQWRGIGVVFEKEVEVAGREVNGDGIDEEDDEVTEQDGTSVSENCSDGSKSKRTGGRRMY